MATFWALALGYVEEPGYEFEDGASIVDPDGAEPVARGVALMPVRVLQRLLADPVQPGPLLVGEDEIGRGEVVGRTAGQVDQGDRGQHDLDRAHGGRTATHTRPAPPATGLSRR